MAKVYGTPNVEAIKKVALQIVRELEEESKWQLMKKSS
jgi:hypothetical protein